MFNDATVILSMSWSIYKLYWVKILRLRHYCISNTHRTREARHGTSCGDRPLSCCPSPRAFTGMPRSRKFDLFVCLFVYKLDHRYFMNVFGNDQINSSVYFLSFKIDVDNGEEYFLNCCEKVLTSLKLLVSLKNYMVMNQLILIFFFLYI